MTMGEAIDSSLSYNPNLKEVYFREDAAGAAVSRSTSSFLPQIHANAGYTKYEEPTIVTPIHEQGVFPPLDDQIYEANVQLQVPLFDGGRRLASRRIASAVQEERQAYSRLVRNDVLRQIAEVFLLSHQADDQLELLNERLVSLYQQATDLKDLEDEGRATTGDVALVSSFIGETRSDSAAVMRSIHQLNSRLGLLVGKRGPVIPRTADGESSSDDLYRQYPHVSPVTDTLLGPQAMISQARQEQSEAQAALAARSFWPEVSGFGLYQYRSGSDWEPVGEWAVGVTISLPIFTGGERIHRVRETSALSRASTMRAKQAELEETWLLRTAYDDYLTAWDQSIELASAVRDRAVSVDAYLELYQAGRIPLRDLQIQQTELLKLQLDENAAQYATRLALLEYESLAGTLTRSTALFLAGESQ